MAFVTACAGGFCFAPYARVTFVIARKVTKNASPHLGFSLRENFPRSVAAPGAGLKGHPWPSSLSAAPGRYDPLRNDSTRPGAQGAGKSKAKDQELGPCRSGFSRDSWKRKSREVLTHRCTSNRRPIGHEIRRGATRQRRAPTNFVGDFLGDHDRRRIQIAGGNQRHDRGVHYA